MSLSCNICPKINTLTITFVCLHSFCFNCFNKEKCSLCNEEEISKFLNKKFTFEQFEQNYTNNDNETRLTIYKKYNKLPRELKEEDKAFEEFRSQYIKQNKIVRTDIEFNFKLYEQYEKLTLEERYRYYSESKTKFDNVQLVHKEQLNKDQMNNIRNQLNELVKK